MTDHAGKSASPFESPYAGRWVARLQGKVISQGNTPEEARLAAQTQRHKETPEIVFMQTPFSFSQLLTRVTEALESDQEIFLVGGAIRDALLNLESRDLDFAVPRDGIKIARRVANHLDGAFYPLDVQRDTGRVILFQEDDKRTIMDFASYRGDDIEMDIRNRDFTINAIAYDLQTNEILDPLNGVKDLHTKLIRTCSTESISMDPVRILRAVRLAAGFGLKIDGDTRHKMKQHVELLRDTSQERLRDEIFRILEGPQPGTAIRALDILNGLGYILPELPALKGVEQSSPHVYDVWTHTLSVLNHLEDIQIALAPEYDPESTGDLFSGLLVMKLGRYRDRISAHFKKRLNTNRSLFPLLYFAALYHDIAKPTTKTIDEDGRIRFFGHDEQGGKIATSRLKILHLSNDEILRVQLIIKHHMRIHFHINRLEKDNKTPSRKALYRYFRDTGEAGIDLLLLALADVRATRGHLLTQDTWAASLAISRIFLENYWERPTETVSPPQLLNGSDLITEFKLSPGPRIGILLEAIREGQATGKIAHRKDAIDFVRNWLKENA